MKSIVSFGAVGLPLLISTVTGAPASTSGHTAAKTCVELMVPVPVVATNLQYTQPRVDNSVDAIDWTLNTTIWSTPKGPDRVTGAIPVDRTFSINAQLCVPAEKGPRSDILQLATNGLGFDKRYWDVEINPSKYSYLDAAISHGYSVLTYDRLGTGKSDKPDAYDIVQIPVETELLASLTKIVRSGQLLATAKVLSRPSLSSTTTTIPKTYTPKQIVHVGHSFGSLLVAQMLAAHGASCISDGALLTGYLMSTKLGLIDVAHFDHEYAAEHDPVRYPGSEYGSGYIVLTTQSDLQKLFLRKGAFEPELLDYLERIKQPEAVGEYASQGTTRFDLPARGFRGPIQFFAGEFDYITCGGNCTGTLRVNETYGLYPDASKIAFHLQPNTGHSLALAANASAGYEVMFDFLESNGL